MKVPLEITFRNVPRSSAVEERIRAKAAKLDRFYDQITGCRVVIEAPHNRRQKGNVYHVRIDLQVPGQELVVNREPARNLEHQDLYVAIRDAFNAAQRQLQGYARRRKPTGAHRAVTGPHALI